MCVCVRVCVSVCAPFIYSHYDEFLPYKSIYCTPYWHVN